MFQLFLWVQKMMELNNFIFCANGHVHVLGNGPSSFTSSTNTPWYANKVVGSGHSGMCLCRQILKRKVARSRFRPSIFWKFMGWSSKGSDYFGREQFAYGGVVLSGQTTRDTGHFGLFPTRKITPFKWRSPNLWWPWIHYSRVTNGELNGWQMSEISCFVLKSNDIKKQLKCQALTICWITSRFEFIIVE